MEHISRGVLPSMQTAILVSDCSRRGVQAVGRIAELIKECDMHPDTVGLIINRAPGGKLNDGIREEIEKQGLHLLGVVPQDETVYEYDCEGKPTAGLPEDNPVKMALREIVVAGSFIGGAFIALMSLYLKPLGSRKRGYGSKKLPSRPKS